MLQRCDTESITLGGDYGRGRIGRGGCDGIEEGTIHAQ